MSTPAGPAATADATPAAPAPATFRAVPLPALVAVGFGVLGLSPIAFQGGAWWAVLVVPVLVAGWLVRTRTVVDADGLRVLRVLGRRTIGWGSVSTLRVVERGWVRAVRVDGGEDRLVGVRVRDLGRVGVASGGRISMPTPAEAEAAAEREQELAAARMRVQQLRERHGRAAVDGEEADPEQTDAEQTDAEQADPGQTDPEEADPEEADPGQDPPRATGDRGA